MSSKKHKELTMYSKEMFTYDIYKLSIVIHRKVWYSLINYNKLDYFIW